MKTWGKYIHKITTIHNTDSNKVAKKNMPKTYEMTLRRMTLAFLDGYYYYIF